MRARALAIRTATEIKLKRLEQFQCVQRMLFTAIKQLPLVHVRFSGGIFYSLPIALLVS